MAAFPTVSSAAAGISGNPLVIGGVSLVVPDSPQELSFGAGTQKLVVTEYPGGGRSVARFGAQPKPVTVTGTVYQPNVDATTSALQSYMVDGLERLASWKGQRYYVIVKDYTPRFRRGGQMCDYEVVLEVTRDANGAFTVASATSVDSQVGALSNTAATSLQQITAVNLGPPPQVDLSGITLQVQNAGPLAQASATNIATLLTTVQAQLAAATAYLGGLSSTAAAFIPAQRLVSALTLIAENVQNGQAQRTLTQQGGSLYQIASRFYGDPTRAFDLAALNGLSAMQLSSAFPTTLRIPPYPTQP